MLLVRRRLLQGVVLGAGGALLAACGQAPAAAPAPAEPAKEAPKAEAPKPAAAPKEAAVVRILFVPGHADAARSAILERVLGGYTQANPNVQLQVRNIAQGQTALQLITVLSAAGTPMGLVEDDWGPWLGLADTNIIVELTPYFARDKLDPQALFVAEGIDFLSHQGKIYGMPISMSVDAWGYNVDLFDAAGLKYPPTDPEDRSWTMEAFLDAARKLTKSSEQFGMSRAYNGYNPGGITDGTYFGGVAFDVERQVATMNTEPFKRGMNFWIDMVDKYHAMPTPDEWTALRTSPGDPFFTTGKLAMSVEYSVSEVAKQAKFKWAFGAIPYSGEGRNHSGRHYTHSLLVGNTDYKDTTWDLLKWLLEPGNAIGYLEKTGHVVTPVLAAQALAKEAYEKKWGVDTTAVFLESTHTLQSGQGMLKFPTWPEITAKLNPMYADVRARKLTVEEYLPQAEKIINDNLLAK